MCVCVCVCVYVCVCLYVRERAQKRFCLCVFVCQREYMRCKRSVSVSVYEREFLRVLASSIAGCLLGGYAFPRRP